VLDTSRCEHFSWKFLAVWRIRSEGSYVPPKVPPVGLSSGLGESHPYSGLLLLRPCRSISTCIRLSTSPSRGFPSQGAAQSFEWAVPPCRSSVVAHPPPR
jgi:hypothetical protein